MHWERVFRFRRIILAYENSFKVDPTLAPRRFIVHSGTKKPADGFVAVPYEGLWFWLDWRTLTQKSPSWLLRSCSTS